MSKAIGVGEVGLFGIIAVAGLLGFWVQSCNKSSIVNHDIEERQHEFDVEHPAVCKDHSFMIAGWGSDDKCEPGEVPEYKDLGTPASGKKTWLFCSCSTQTPVDVKAEADKVYLDYIKNFYGGKKQETLPFGKLNEATKEEHK
jgi:hypothetical protein